jgi:hypothetical protein
MGSDVGLAEPGDAQVNRTQDAYAEGNAPVSCMLCKYVRIALQVLMMFLAELEVFEAFVVGAGLLPATIP